MTAKAQMPNDSLNQIWENKSMSDSVRTRALFLLAGQIRMHNPQEAQEILVEAIEEFSGEHQKKYQVKLLPLLIHAKAEVGDLESALTDCKKTLELAISIQDSMTEASVHNVSAMIYSRMGKHQKSFDSMEEAIRVIQAMKKWQTLATLYANLGIAYERNNSDVLALDVLNRANDTLMKYVPNGRNIAQLNTSIGIIYVKQKLFPKAMEHYAKALKIFKALNDSFGLADLYGNLGVVHKKIHQYDSAHYYYRKSLEIRLGGQNDGRVSETLGNLMNLFKEQGQKDSAVYYGKWAIESRKDALPKTKQDATIYVGYGHVFLELFNDYKNASKWCEKGVEISKGGNWIEEEADGCLCLKTVYSKFGNFKEAFKYSERYFELDKQIINQEKTRDLVKVELESKFTKELLQDSLEYAKSNEISELKLKSQESELEQERLQNKVANNRLIAISVLVIFVLFVLAFILFLYRQKTRSGKMLAQKNQTIEFKNREIIESINYAERIQKSVLPEPKELSPYFAHQSLFFKPQNMVSGDFYWWAPLNKDEVIFALGDCTGHGVPGGFMSMMASSILSNIFKTTHLSNPSEILSKMDEDISGMLRQKKDHHGVGDDGVDIVVIHYNKLTQALTFASANQSIHVVQDGLVRTYHGDIYSVGGIFSGIQKAFRNESIQISPSDSVFLATDGLHDQFGGSSKMEKFGSERLEKLLQKLALNSFDNHESIAKEALLAWQGSGRQIDDISLFGLKI